MISINLSYRYTNNIIICGILFLVLKMTSYDIRKNNNAWVIFY